MRNLRWLVNALAVCAACGRIGFGASDGLEPDGFLGPDIDVDMTRELGPFTYTRSGIASYVDATGIVRLAAADDPRFDHDPQTFMPLGVLFEPKSQNLCRHSARFDDGPTTWPATGQLDVTGDVAVAPDGTMSADALTDNDSVTPGRRLQGFLISTAPLPYTFSVFMRGATSTRASFAAELLGGSTQIQVHMNINLATGSFVTVGGPRDAGIQAYPNGWYRVWLTIDNNNTGNNDAVISLWSDRSNPANNGTYLAWGAQVEQSPVMSSYIPTATTSSTRGVDMLTATVPAAAQGTLVVAASTYAEAVSMHPAACIRSGASVVCVGRDAAMDRTELAAQDTLFGETWQLGVLHTVAAQWTPTTTTLWERTMASSSPKGTNPVTQVEIGAAGSVSLQGHVRRVAFRARVLDDAELGSFAP